FGTSATLPAGQPPRAGRLTVRPPHRARTPAHTRAPRAPAGLDLAGVDDALAAGAGGDDGVVLLTAQPPLREEAAAGQHGHHDVPGARLQLPACPVPGIEP